MCKNEEVPQGIYLYVVKYSLIQNESVEQTGTITLIS